MQHPKTTTERLIWEPPLSTTPTSNTKDYLRIIEHIFQSVIHNKYIVEGPLEPIAAHQHKDLLPFIFSRSVFLAFLIGNE